MYQLSLQNTQSLRLWHEQIWTCEGKFSGGDGEQKRLPQEAPGLGSGIRRAEGDPRTLQWVGSEPYLSPQALEDTFEDTSGSPD